MKKPMNRFLLFLTALLVTGIMSSCKEEGPHKDNIIKLSATINSQQTVPRVTATGQGVGVFEYNKTTMELKYNITFQNIQPTFVTLNRAEPAWEAGQILSTLATSPTTTQVQGSVKLNAEQQTALVIKQLYINIPTSENIYGAIRGQIVPDGQTF
jgi:hypothetical protein